MTKIDPMLLPDAATIESYSKALQELGATPEALGWLRPEKMAMRYEALCGDFKPTALILDFGCGLGGLASWLDEIDFEGSYSGFDPCAEAIAAAKAIKREPADRYLFRHIKGPQDLPKAEWDHIVCCGVFTRMGDRNEDNHRIHIRQTLAKLFQHCRIGLHVDFLDAGADIQEPGNLHVQPWDAVALAKTMSPRVAFDASYLPFEFCLHIYRDAALVTPANVYGRAVK